VFIEEIAIKLDLEGKKKKKIVVCCLLVVMTLLVIPSSSAYSTFKEQSTLRNINAEKQGWTEQEKPDTVLKQENVVQ